MSGNGTLDLDELTSEELIGAAVSDDTTSGIYFSSLEAKNKSLVVSTRSNPGYSSGYVYYVDGRKALRATAMDVSNGRVAGEPFV